MTTAIERTAPPSPLVRVERGLPSEDELAALTVALLSRATTRESAADASAAAPVPLWDRPELHTPYRIPASWRR
ncbi:acyl-CoA carboxylase subunit epsilon [Streptomyces sp. NPDC057499]|uniref:acyl-CoA carboxylase subunit epsilon n=1 Tax=Streptomyces sp. NPDC057499 TaxID=3346150 RepID=UPI00367E3E48